MLENDECQRISDEADEADDRVADETRRELSPPVELRVLLPSVVLSGARVEQGRRSAGRPLSPGPGPVPRERAGNIVCHIHVVHCSGFDLQTYRFSF